MNNFIKITFSLILGFSFSCGADAEPDTKQDPTIVIQDSVLDDDMSMSSPDASELPIEDEPNLCPRDGELLCDGKCVNAQISLQHCGACFNTCIAGRMTCDGTACVCLEGKGLCDNDCWDLQITRQHCGACGNVCQDSEACVEGGCVEISSRPEVVGVLAETNIGRSVQQDCGEHGIKRRVGAVQLNDKLMLAAQKHSEDMALNDFMEHTGSDGSMPRDRATAQGYVGNSVGENIAMGYKTPKLAIEAWIDSDGHCKNMMDPEYTELGVGFAASPTTGRFYWTQLFGSL